MWAQYTICNSCERITEQLPPLNQETKEPNSQTNKQTNNLSPKQPM